MKYLIVILVLLVPRLVFATLYLDASPGQDCAAGTYRVVERDCNGSSTGDQSYDDLANFSANIVAQATNYIRAGAYSRNTSSNSTGALAITTAGTSGSHTIISAYTGEERQAIIHTGTQTYNSDPSDTTYAGCTPGASEGGANCYYPCPAISIGAQYVDVIGVKTFGQVVIYSSNTSLQYSDVGGSGPYINQGQVIHINGTNPALTGVLIENNHIHHSSWGESSQNGATLMIYEINGLTIRYNKFSVGWGSDIRLKDTRYGGGAGTITIENNLFVQSSIRSANSGIEGIGQYGNIASVIGRNNIFIGKGTGITTKLSPDNGEAYWYNNTFVNCTHDFDDADANQQVYIANNLHYHDAGSSLKYIDMPFTVETNYATLDWQMYYSSGVTPQWESLNVGPTSTWATWQGGTNIDEDNSINGTDPSFSNITNCKAYDVTGCKRDTYSENFAASPYGTRAGAYETGSEQIGYDWGAVDTTAPTTVITSTDPQTNTSDPLSIVGTASDDTAVTSCKYRVGSAPDASNGTACTGTTSWTCSVDRSVFVEGANTLYVGCTDAAANWGAGDSITVYNPVVGTVKNMSFSNSGLK